MAEPKTSDDDLKRELKKASKKSSKKTVPSAAPEGPPAVAPKTPPANATPQKPVAATPTPSMNDVPKMNFSGANLGTPSAEPKSDAPDADKLKKKASKKKAPEPAAPPTAAVAPTVEALAPAATPKDNEEERARQAARREAKRQKQKEMEEAKRREMERQALELAKREEEAKQRELRKAEELAALNANAEECQEEDDYDEDFENYDDDNFEDDPAKDKTKSNQREKTSAVDDATVQKIREALHAESKAPAKKSSAPPPLASQAKDSKDAKASSGGAKKTNASIAALKQSIDPRAKRVKEVLEKKKFDTERFELFQQLPLTEVDKYMNQLRIGIVRQVFVQTNDDARGVATQTKSRETKDQSMHFPDDMGIDSTSNSTSHQFIRFLVRASHVVEVLLEENLMHAEAANDTTAERTHSIAKANEWSTNQLTTRDHALLQARSILDLSFSAQVSHWLLCAYGPSDDNNAVLGDKSLLCVWDLNQIETPVRWLRSEGVVSCCSMGPGRDMFALCGTDEGVVQLWDLRLRPSPYFEVLIPSRDKVCVVPPTYSTAGMKHELKTNHAAPIVAVRPIHAKQQGASFQFGSLDNRGLVIVWSVVEFRADNEAVVGDSCVEFGGRLKLVKTAVVDSAMLSSSNPLQVGPSAFDLAFFPSDSNQFVVATTNGSIVHASRFDKKLAVKTYRRGYSGVSTVTSLDFHSFMPGYFLAGYADGSVSLFHTDLAQDVATWFEASVPVTRVQWSPSRPGAFYVLSSNGALAIWDLLASRMSPIVSVVGKRKGRALFSLSADVARTCRPCIAISDGTNQLEIHELSPILAQKTKDEAVVVDKLLAGVI
ncbi:unnamed protein product [Aphanomyces euteiches]|uniref:WD repeat-containing protein 60 n=3 Tax=Aphanomyces euteiches TaxID=100861 RepID=A0A6G0XU80_9STRA|nr:hypothetical protein Ae201684_001325 [Aphanomyces euteiches]KAH9100046.1 hypothetical protein Ae201684P_019049 [Aphanomyces euteiches]KAH9139622.1 hypothetical protein AeRB84_016099 [Aphanomyces euteiches]